MTLFSLVSAFDSSMSCVFWRLHNEKAWLCSSIKLYHIFLSHLFLSHNINLTHPQFYRVLLHQHHGNIINLHSPYTKSARLAVQLQIDQTLQPPSWLFREIKSDKNTNEINQWTDVKTAEIREWSRESVAASRRVIRSNLSFSSPHSLIAVYILRARWLTSFSRLFSDVMYFFSLVSFTLRCFYFCASEIFSQCWRKS